MFVTQPLNYYQYQHYYHDYYPILTASHTSIATTAEHTLHSFLRAELGATLLEARNKADAARIEFEQPADSDDSEV